MTEPPITPDDEQDNLFEPGSDANFRAREVLRETLLKLGYNVHQPKHHEGTLRVYLDKGVKYPLLNPRFDVLQDNEDPDDDSYFGVVTVSVWSGNGEPADLDELLRTFEPSEDVVFVPADTEDRPATGLVVHGHFVLTLPFVADTETDDIDFAALMAPFRRIRNHLLR